MMPNVLRRLKIREVSSVDRGAGEGVKVMLAKRALSEEHPSGVPNSPKRGKKERPPKTLFEHQQAARAAYDTGTGTVRSGRGVSPETGDKSRHGRQRHLKRDVSPKARERLAGEGHALPGGGFPIASVGDLKNAIRAIGRAKNPGKTRSHIRRQAARLGRTDLIPDNWGGDMKKANDKAGKGGKKPSFPGAAMPFGGKKPSKKTAKALVKTAGDLGAVRALLKGGVSFEEMMSEMSSMDNAEGLIEAIRDATHAIKDSIESIADCDDMMPNDKATAIAESLSQFKDHIAGIAPSNITKALKEGVGSMSKLTKAMKKAYTSVPAHDATPPTKDGDTKIDPDADEDVTAGTGINPPKTATTKKELKKMARKFEKRLAKSNARLAASLTLEKAAKDYMDAAGKDMKEEDKKKFLDLTPADREKFMKKNPIATIAEKHLGALPEPIRKQLEEGKAATVEVVKMREAAELADFAKRAAAVGQGAEFAGHLRTLAKGAGTEEERAKAYAAVETALKAGAEQARTAGLFKEFGSGLGGTGSAWDQLMAKAEELRGAVTKANGVVLTPEQAFAKVYEDSANRELVKQYNQEKNRAV